MPLELSNSHFGRNRFQTETGYSPLPTDPLGRPRNVASRDSRPRCGAKRAEDETHMVCLFTYEGDFEWIGNNSYSHNSSWGHSAWTIFVLHAVRLSSSFWLFTASPGSKHMPVCIYAKTKSDSLSWS